MKDGFDRRIDYLRVSVTDRCNLRCVYCMPPDGVGWMEHAQILSFEEMLTFCEMLAEMGIRKIKVTGGEPLVRKGAVHFIRSLKAIPGIEQVTLTTNGVLLEHCMDELAEIGLDGLNISLDTLDPQQYADITRSYGLKSVLKSLDRAMELGLRVKLNCVPVRELNWNQIANVAELARERVAAVRFIELMPIGCASNLTPVENEEVLERLEQAYGPAEPYEGILGNGPAVYYSLPGFKGKIGLISAISHEFCNGCNRLRLTSEGYLKTCLYSEAGADLKSLLRSGADELQLKEAVRKQIACKPRHHEFADRTAAGRDSREMFRIGG